MAGKSCHLVGPRKLFPRVVNGVLRNAPGDFVRNAAVRGKSVRMEGEVEAFARLALPEQPWEQGLEFLRTEWYGGCARGSQTVGHEG